MLGSHETCNGDMLNRDAMRSVEKCCQSMVSFQKTAIGGALQPETSSCELPSTLVHEPQDESKSTEQ